MTGYELVKAVQTHRLAAIIHEGRDAILIAMVVAMAMWIITFVVMVVAMTMLMVVVMMVVMTMLMVMLVFIIMMVLVVMVLMLFFHIAFHLLNPCSRSGYLFEVKELGVENLSKRHIAIVTFDDLCFGLNCANNGNYLLSLFFVNF